MEMTCLGIAGAALLVVGLAVIAFDAWRRRSQANAFPQPDNTTHMLDDTALQGVPPAVSDGPAPSQARLMGAVVGRLRGIGSAGISALAVAARTGRRPQPRRALFDRVVASVPRRAMLLLVIGSFALIFLSITILVTGANPQAQGGATTIAIARFAGSTRTESGPGPDALLADYLARNAAAGGISNLTIRQVSLLPTSPAQAEAERAKLAADLLIWGEIGTQGDITAVLTLAPGFAPNLPPWRALSDPDAGALILPPEAVVYLPAGRGIDPLVPLSVALVRFRQGDMQGTAEAAWGAQATLDQNGGSSPGRFPTLLRAAALLLNGDYSESAEAVDSLMTTGEPQPYAFLVRAQARLLSADYSGASDDAGAAIGDRDSSPALLARAYLLRARARLGVGDLTGAAGDLDAADSFKQPLVRLRLERAEVYYRQSQPALAASELDALLKVAPEAAPAYRLLGLVRLMLGEPQQALVPLGKARQLYTRWIDQERKNEAQAQATGDEARAHLASDSIVTLNKGLAGIALYEGMAYADMARREPPESFLAGVWRGLRGEQSTAEKALSFMQEAERLDPRRADVPLQMGSLLTFMGRFDEAEGKLNHARELDPSTPEPYIGMAQLQERAGRLSDAILTIESLLERVPRHYPAYEYLHRLHTTSNDSAAAAAALERGIALEARTPADHMWRGRFMRLLGNHDAAEPELLAATADPDLWEAHLLLAQFYLERGRNPEALLHFQAVLEKQPNHEVALLGAGRLLVLAGRADDALALLERLTTVAPGNVEGHIALLELLISRGESARAVTEGQKAVAADPGRAESYFFLGLAFEAAGRWSEASAAYAESTRRNPQDFQSFLNWSHTLLREDRYTASIEVSNFAINLRPADPQPYRARAEAEINLGDVEGALASLQEALRLAPSDPGVLALASRAYTVRGEEQPALDYARRALEAGQNDPSGSLALGEAQLALARPEDALQAFGTALELARTPLEAALALTGQGRAHAQGGDTARASSAYASASARDRTAAEPHLYMGNLYAQAGAADAALGEYRAAVALRPNWPVALYYLGSAYLSRRDTSNAAASFARAVQFSPNMYDAWFGLGLAKRDGGHLNDAVGALRQATALKQDYAEAWLYLGLTLEETGQRGEAADAFARAEANATSDAVHDQAREGQARVR